MTMHKALHHKKDIDRLDVSRKEGGREFTSIEDSIDTSICRLEDYKKKKEKITATRNSTNSIINRTTRKQKWEEKQLYGYFKRQISEISPRRLAKKGKP